MTSHNYRVLLEQISQLTLIPARDLSEEMTHLSLRDVSFTLYATTDRNKDYLVAHADMGPLPQRRREEVLMRLFDVNFFLFNAPKTSSFSLNAQTGHVMFSVAQPLAGLTGQLVLNQLGFMAEQTLVWRDNYFLSDQAKPVTAAAQNTRPSLGLKNSLARGIL